MQINKNYTNSNIFQEIMTSELSPDKIKRYNLNKYLETFVFEEH